MRWQPELTFNGDCEAAFELYARCFGGTVTTLLRYGESPMMANTAAAMHSKIVHATLTVNDVAVLSGGDVAPDAYKQPAGFDVLITLDDPAEAERIFNTLAERGRIQLPLQQTFWAMRFGMVVDRFGTPWKINCGKPA